MSKFLNLQNFFPPPSSSSSNPNCIVNKTESGKKKIGPQCFAVCKRLLAEFGKHKEQTLEFELHTALLRQSIKGIASFFLKKIYRL